MTWEKVSDRAPYYLEVRRGARKTSYRVNYRRDGITLVKTLSEDFGDNWRKALKEADDLIAHARLSCMPDNPMVVRCEDLCNELVKISESRAAKTHEQTELMMRLHLIPWLNANCAYAKDLNGTVWANYRAFKRRMNPEVTLKAHYESFAKLCRYAREKGIIKSFFKLDYDRERDDFKEDGMVIPKADLLKMLKAAPEEKRTPGGKLIATYHVELAYFESWRDRIILQRATGMRPGEVRLLRKDRVTFYGKHAIIRLKKEDTKTRQARPVPVSHPLALAVLRARWESDSPYFFPAKGEPNQPVGGSTKGWHKILERAGVNPKYTPHDLRHTFLSDMFRGGANPALTCFTCGLSLEEAQKTYLHFTEEDSLIIGRDAATRLSFIKS